MAEFRPLPESPTNADLAGGIQQVHGCLEDFKRSTNLQMASLRKGQVSMARKVKEVQDLVISGQEEIEHIAGNQVLLSKSLGLISDGAKKPRKPVLLMPQAELAMKATGFLGGIFLLWKFGDFALPKFVQFIIEMDKWVQH